jgi:hypothetical protein
MNKAKLQRWGMNFPLSKIQVKVSKYLKRLNLRKSIEYKNETDGN